MVNFQVVSDLHIETSEGIPSALTYITPVAEILILAGDIGRIHKIVQLKTFLTDICSHFKIVLYVLGNHEYYRVPGYTDKTMEDLFNDLLHIKQDIPNLYILNRDSVIIDDVCIAGCTLWSEPLIEVPKFIVKIHTMTTRKYYDLYCQDLEYINNMIKYCQEHKLKLVMITHHSPTYYVASHKKEDKYSSLYASNLDHLLIKENIHTWVYGHIHKNYDIKSRGGTRVVSNQKGKPRDNVINFSKEKIIEIV